MSLRLGDIAPDFKAKTSIGDPSVEGVRMGALASKLQVERVRESVEIRLRKK